MIVIDALILLYLEEKNVDILVFHNRNVLMMVVVGTN